MGKLSALSDPASLIGITLSGGYRTERLLDEAGRGIVLAAKDHAGHAVAVKVLRPEVATEEALSRVSREASVLSKLNDRHVVPILDVGHDLKSDLVYLVMPLLHGTDVAQLLDRLGVLSPAAATRIALQASSALIAAHAAGVAFRDLCPAKLFLENTADGEIVVRVLGPGLGESDAPGLDGGGLGTTPGRTSGGTGSGASVRADRRADLFCLGAALYQMLSGRPPIPDDPPSSRRGPSSGRIPPIQDVAPWVEAPLALALHPAIAGDLHRRYASAEAFHEMLRAVAGGDDAITKEMLAPLSQAARSVVAARADFDADPLVGCTLGSRYKLLRLIGRGGMGGVYEAEAKGGRRLAVKIIFRSAAGQDDQHMRRFIREARAATAIDSPHVVKTIELGTDLKLGSPFIAMELLHGIDVARLLREKGPLRPPQVVRIFAQAARGLAEAHKAGIVHRDVKPANLFLHTPAPGENAVVKVCDFGVAKRSEDGMAHDLTREGGVLGSPLYMSPEQAKTASHVDHRSDVWGLSVSLYQALCGSTPWDPNASLAELLLAICTERVPPLADAAPWVSRELCSVVHKGLARDPDERWQSMEALVAALAPHTGGTEELRTEELVPVSPADLASATPIESLRERAPRSQSAAQLSKNATTSTTGSRTIEPDPGATAGTPPKSRAGVLVLGALAFGVVATFFLVRPPPSPQLVAPGYPVQNALQHASVKVPEDSAVQVNGAPAIVESGAVELAGEAGDAFDLVVRVGDAERSVRVILTRDGHAEPDRVDAPAPIKTAVVAATATPTATVTAAPRPPVTSRVVPAATGSGPGTGDLHPR